jgi:hypothetical protein
VTYEDFRRVRSYLVIAVWGASVRKLLGGSYMKLMIMHSPPEHAILEPLEGVKLRDDGVPPRLLVVYFKATDEL